MIILNYLQNYFLMEDIMTTQAMKLTQATSPLSITPGNSGVVQVEGFAVHCGTFNDVTITKEELDKGAFSIVGSPVIKAHDMYGNPEDVVIGKVTHAECKVDPSNAVYGLFYRAEIDALEHELIRKMELDFVSSTSIGFRSEHICSLCGNSIWSPDCDHWFWDEGFQILAKDINIHELSIVAVPADADATVTVSFAKDDRKAFEELQLKKESRRTIMSDFEKKYNEVVDEFSKFKIDSADELNNLKNEFSQKKEELELEMAGKTEEILSLKNDIDTLSKENESLKETVSKYEETFSKIEEEKLSGLRSELSQLNEEVHGGLTEERINELGESSLKEFIEIFSNQKEHIITLSPTHKSGEQYKQETEVDKDAAPLSQLAARLGI